MYREAYLALEAIKNGFAARAEDDDAWIRAFKACRWAVETDQGLALTSAGMEAFQDLAKTYRRLRAA